MMKIKTVGELKELLEDLDDNLTLKVALQPRYPMSGHLMNVCQKMDTNGEPTEIWLAVSDNEGYGVPEDVWSETEVYPDDE